jgi:PrcB C-terminal
VNVIPVVLWLCVLLGTVSARCTNGMAQGEETQEWRGQYGGEDAATAEVITHAAPWARLWRRLDKPEPRVDFTRDCAVVAFAGLRPTGGYTIEFLDPVMQGEDLLVRWRVRPPAPGSYVTQALARPWKVKVIARPKGSLRAEQVKD